MSEEYNDLIERYFCNELSIAERAAFEQRQATDLAFRREVEDYEKTVRVIRSEGRKALRSKLTEKGRQMDAEKKSPSRRWWAGLAVLAVALFGWWLWGEKTEGPAPVPPADNFASDTARMMAPPLPDTPAPVKPPEINQQLPDNRPTQKTPAATERPNKDQLFAAYFQPYKDDSLEPSVRGDGDATPEETFLQLYWDGKHREALTAFEKMEPASKNKGDLQFLKANCLLATGQAKAAKTMLEDLSRTRFSAEAKWLLALAFLKNGEMERAKQELQEIAGEAASQRQNDASKLLKALD